MRALDAAGDVGAVETSVGRDLDPVECEVGDVHEQVERRRALGGEPRCRALDDEHGRFTVDGRDDRDLVGTVAVDDVADRPVESPAAVGRDGRDGVGAEGEGAGDRSGCDGAEPPRLLRRRRRRG